MYELYYINKFQPKFNTADMFLQESRTDIPELTFVPYLTNGAEQHVSASQNARTYTLLCKNGKIIANVKNPYEKDTGPVVFQISGNPELNKNDLKQLLEQINEIEQDLTS